MRFKIEAEEWSNVLEAASVYQDEAVLNLKEDGILMRVHDESNTAVYNTLIPKSVLSEYERGEYNRVGIYVEQLGNITPSTSDEVLVELDGYKIRTVVGTRDYKIPNIDPDQVSGTPEMVPQLELPVKIRLGPDKILSYIADAYSHVFNNKRGHYFIQAQEGVLVLWCKRDDYELVEHFHWEDFEGYDIDWEAATVTDSMEGDPTEMKKITSIIAIQLTKGMRFFSDTARLEMGHGMPMKMVSESESGIKHSWIIPPRFPKEGEPSQVPENVIKDRTVL